MQITVHVNGYYDWEPLPPDAAKPTKADIESRKVKPTGNGDGYLMKVTKKADTHTSITLPESQLIAVIIDEMCRGDRKPMTRMEAVGRYLSRHVMPHHAHRNWMQEVEVHDDGANEELFEAKIAEQVKAGNLDELDGPPLLAAYKTPGDPQAHVDHLHVHFGIKNHAAFKAKRLAAAAPAVQEVSK